MQNHLIKSWQMKRNCALTPKQLLQCYGLLVCLSITVAVGFFLAGIWVIPIFTALELTAVTIGFLIYAKHALDYETIEIVDQRLIVRKFIGYQESIYEFNTQWAKIEPPMHGQKVFFISQSDQRVELGQFLRQEQQLPLISSVRAHLG